ncbi:MAG: acyl carrier protein [Deltaproteobacteria bacterium]|nr:acyl carrier protein [Deltaproteobacteria bacterium]
MQEILEQVRNFVVETFLLGGDESALGNEDSFLDTGLIDSTGVLELIAFLEERFALQVADEEMIPENLDSIARVARFVHAKGKEQADGRVA